MDTELELGSGNKKRKRKRRRRLYNLADEEIRDFTWLAMSHGETRLRIKQGTRIQTLLMSKSRFDTADKAKKWASAHNFRSDKVDSTENNFRLRQFTPGQCTEGTFGTRTLTRGVQATFCVPKEG